MSSGNVPEGAITSLDQLNLQMPKLTKGQREFFRAIIQEQGYLRPPVIVYPRECRDFQRFLARLDRAERARKPNYYFGEHQAA